MTHLNEVVISCEPRHSSPPSLSPSSSPSQSPSTCPQQKPQRSRTKWQPYQTQRRRPIVNALFATSSWNAIYLRRRNSKNNQESRVSNAGATKQQSDVNKTRNQMLNKDVGANQESRDVLTTLAIAIILISYSP